MDVLSPPMRRVSVVGSTGSGKTTFSRELAATLGLPCIELDAINWGPGWTMIAPEAFRSRVREAIAADGWVVDGNYGGAGVRDVVWGAADTIVWLDLPLTTILQRLLWRTVARLRDGRELWPGTGNRESFREAFLSRKSMLWWAATTYRRRRRQFEGLLALPQYAQLRVLRFTDPATADRWLADLRSLVSSPARSRG